MKKAANRIKDGSRRLESDMQRLQRTIAELETAKRHKERELQVQNRSGLPC